MSGYNAVLKSGSKIHIPRWPVNVAVHNLSHVSNALGSDQVVKIAAFSVPNVIVAVMESKDPKLSTKIVMDFICEARIDGSKIDPSNIDKLFDEKLAEVFEIFTHVIHSQYSDFFASGLVKEPSPTK